MVVNEGRLDGEATVLIDNPVITLIDCEVQKPARSGELETRLGTIGAGIVMQPNGSPRVLIDVRHADSTALAVILNGDLLRELIEILADTHNEATLSQRENEGATRQ